MDAFKLSQALKVMSGVSPQMEAAAEKIAKIYGIRIVDNDGYNGDYPQGKVGAIGSTEFDISVNEDLVRNAANNTEYCAALGRLCQARQRRYVANGNPITDEYLRLNPIPMSAWFLDPALQGKYRWFENGEQLPLPEYQDFQGQPIIVGVPFRERNTGKEWRVIQANTDPPYLIPREGLPQ
ncbi:MAG: hypothetical protein FWF18_03330 [Dehalococcoidia bacterium]|nr:hypothetical protein [Dehalococcoidia bacterium]